MTSSDLLKRYAKGEREFQRADLNGADLNGADLSGADLRSANLRSAYLRGANLMCADLSGADLTGANLTGANLMCANLRGAYLTGANLTGANLRGADLRGADLTSANLTSANLTGADLTSAYLRSALGQEDERAIKLLGPVENLGIDARGYTLWAFRAAGGLGGNGRWVIQASCRLFESIIDALRHWGSMSYPDRKRGQWFVRRIKLLWDEE